MVTTQYQRLHGRTGPHDGLPLLAEPTGGGRSAGRQRERAVRLLTLLDYFGRRSAQRDCVVAAGSVQSCRAGVVASCSSAFVCVDTGLRRLAPAAAITNSMVVPSSGLHWSITQSTKIGPSIRVVASNRETGWLIARRWIDVHNNYFGIQRCVFSIYATRCYAAARSPVRSNSRVPHGAPHFLGLCMNRGSVPTSRSRSFE